MTSIDWLNVAQCAQQRRESENLSNRWFSDDYSRFVELICAETSLLLKMVNSTDRTVW